MYLHNILESEPENIDQVHFESTDGELLSTKPIEFYTTLGILRRTLIKANIPIELLPGLIDCIFAIYISQHTLENPEVHMDFETDGYAITEMSKTLVISRYMFDLKHGIEIEYLSRPRSTVWSIKKVSQYSYGELHGKQLEIYSMNHRHLSRETWILRESNWVHGELRGLVTQWCLRGSPEQGFEKTSVYTTGHWITRNDEKVQVGEHITYVMHSDAPYDKYIFNDEGEKLKIIRYWNNGTCCHEIEYINKNIYKEIAYYTSGSICRKGSYYIQSEHSPGKPIGDHIEYSPEGHVTKQEYYPETV